MIWEFEPSLVLRDKNMYSELVVHSKNGIWERVRVGKLKGMEWEGKDRGKRNWVEWVFASRLIHGRSFWRSVFPGTGTMGVDHGGSMRGQFPPEFGVGGLSPRFCHVAKF